MGARGVNHLLRVGNVPIANDAIQRVARNRRNEWFGAGGDQQSVVMRLSAVVGGDDSFDPVDSDNAAVEQQFDVVAQVPIQIVEHDFVEFLLAGQHGREQDAIVIGVRLGAEHGDVVQVV